MHILPHERIDADLFNHCRRSWARVATTEELHAEITALEWLLATDDDDEEYPLETAERSRMYRRAVIAAARAELTYRDRRGVSLDHVDTGYPREFLDTIKSAARLEHDIGAIVELRQHGRTLRGRCPAHNGVSDTSLTVWPDDQRFYCFGCQIKGDIFAWLQMAHSWTFRDAVMHLADRAGVPLPKTPIRANGVLGDSGHVSAPFVYRRRGVR